jgi:hypothetical protein
VRLDDSNEVKRAFGHGAMLPGRVASSPAQAGIVSATRRALAAMVKAGFWAPDDGKNAESTT